MIRRIFSIFIFVLAALVTLEAALWVRSWNNFWKDAHIKAGSGPRRVLVIGDSITGNDGEVSYVTYMKERLQGSSSGRAFEVINLSRPANLTSWVKVNLPKYLKEYSPEFVVLMIGKPDQNHVDQIQVSPFFQILQNSRLLRLLSVKAIEVQLPFQAVRATLFGGISQGTLNSLVEDEENDEITASEKEPLAKVKQLIKMAETLEKNTDLKGAYERYSFAFDVLKKSLLLDQYPEMAASIFCKKAEISAVQNDMKTSSLELAHAKKYISKSERNGVETKTLSELNIQLGIAHGARKEFKQAESAHQNAIRLAPQLPKAHIQLAWLYFQLGDWASSRNEFAKGLRIAPNYERGIRALSQTSVFDGHFLEGKKILLEILPRSSQKSLILLQIAGLDNLMGNKEEALLRLEQARSQSPESRTIYLGELWFFRELGHHDKVEKLFREMKLEWNSPLTRITAQNYQQIVQLVLEASAHPIAVQYPSERVEPLEVILSKFTDRVQVLSTREMLLKTSSGDSVSRYFADDFQHLSSEGARIVGHGLADAILARIN